MTRAETAVALVYAADTLHFHRHKNRLSPKKARRLLTRADTAAFTQITVCAADTERDDTAFSHPKFWLSPKARRLLTRADTAVALVCAVLRTHCVPTVTKSAKSKSKKVVD